MGYSETKTGDNQLYPEWRRVFQVLQREIASGELPVGTRLVEADVAQRLGVSRSPVREALRRLEEEGFVERRRRRGAVVAGLTWEEMGEVLEIRAALEGLAASLAAERGGAEQKEQLQGLLPEIERAAREEDVWGLVEADTQFHALIFTMAHNRRLEKLMESLWLHVRRYRTYTLSVPGRSREIVLDHQRLVNAIVNNHPERARRLSTAHVLMARQHLLRLLQEEEEAGKASSQAGEARGDDSG